MKTIPKNLILHTVTNFFTFLFFVPGSYSLFNFVILQLCKKGIKITIVCPGPIETKGYGVTTSARKGSEVKLVIIWLKLAFTCHLFLTNEMLYNSEFCMIMKNKADCTQLSFAFVAEYISWYITSACLILTEWYYVYRNMCHQKGVQN